MRIQWLLFLLITGITSSQYSYADDVVPNNRVVNGVSIRPAPSSQNQPISLLRPGNSLPYLSDNNRYYYEVQLPNGNSGWVSKSWTEIVSTSSAPTTTNNNLIITFFDVGQGDSTLIACPNGNNILIDAGSTSGIEADIIRDQLIGALNDREMRIHTLIITHPDADHYNRLVDVLDGINIDQLYRVGDQNDYYRSFWQWMNQLNTTIVDLNVNSADTQNQPNTEIGCGNAEIYILAANEQSNFSTKNSSSIVLMVRHQQFEAVFTGDATRITENAILNRYPASWLDIDLLKIGHHGSLATSTQAVWADTLTPELAVVSAGTNSYGHPRTEVIERLDQHTVNAASHPMNSATRVNRRYTYTFDDNYQESIYSTQVSGIIEVTSDGNGWTVATWEVEIQ